MNVIETQGLVKRYREIRALDGLDLAVPQGSVFGFLGPNGSGKTTTIRVLLGLARSSGGVARLFGEDAASLGDATRSRVGFLPDVPGYYEWMRADEALRFAGSLYGLRGVTLDQRVGVLLEMAGLTGVRQRVGGYSRGMRQRLGIAQALVNAPDLLILDEPTSALDPIGRKDVLDMVASLRGRTTVFFSTHILSDVERVCDRVAIVDRGRVVLADEVASLLRQYGGGRRVVVDVAGDPGILVAAIEGLEWVTGVDLEQAAHALGSGAGRVTIRVADSDRAAHELPAVVARLGLGLVRLEPGEASLEEVFVDLVEGPAAPRHAAEEPGGVRDGEVAS